MVKWSWSSSSCWSITLCVPKGIKITIRIATKGWNKSMLGKAIEICHCCLFLMRPLESKASTSASTTIRWGRDGLKIPILQCSNAIASVSVSSQGPWRISAAVTCRLRQALYRLHWQAATSTSLKARWENTWVIDCRRFNSIIPVITCQIYMQKSTIWCGYMRQW